MSADQANPADRAKYRHHRWKDRHKDVWILANDGLMRTFETAPFPPAHIEKKWGPLTRVR